MLFIEYPPCSTCQRAKKWLDDNGIKYTDRHIKLDNPSYEELYKWYKQSNLELRRFFNTSGLLYKELDLKNKLPNMSDEEKLKLLSTNGMLVKRPIIVSDDFILVGFKENEWKETLLKK